MKNVKILLLALTMMMAMFLAACGGGNEATNSNESKEQAGGDAEKSAGAVEAKIGVIAWMTGSGAGYGEAITNGINLALEEINAKGEVKIDLVVEDSAGKQEQALSAAQKLINSDNVTGLIGPTLSTEMNVVGPEADLAGVPTMGTSTTAQGIPEIGDYIFRDSIPESLAIPAAMQKAIDKYGVKKVAIMYGNDDVFTKSGFDTMKATAEEMGLEILTIETFQKGQSDYNAQLTKIKNLNPELILCSALYNEGAVIMDQARKMGLTVPFVGGNGFNSPEVIKIAGDAANGLIVATPWFGAKEDAKVQEFVKKYTEKFGKEPDQFAAQAYDGLYLFAEAIKNAGEADRDAVRDALAEIKDFEGILGVMSFDEVGDIVMDPTVLVIDGGQFKLFE
ncbi:ABC-type branched-chain amino acid transport system, periplasmic component [Schinkia azotoformans MEV2011]|uniref:ABC-type branched-chain amino acid transport system, periplasmic component n=1 Tax=Schinkia azotoformans MEV2011 TaxID=1348973 RepID=A0A072NF95_SCHAZ|nr:ABC transporter substrate-binding protein [Schinkia azotoformans]KEF36201.1 ABC-type branched-chain amino acid transport system, periplasmic component [Schinkia azotoformans MEV2011]MEC1693878.1 ABC transporter substrate-binding protein [Schinkia azotoformans]MEC1714689.1 ABC transporter substrate-binding protein [Schinkia azotoformans]MEC1724777.1 ABC transporter substrate-binding protein [Schinkia azotoformans]MEC1741136.1 ABC transporter substrate-binding protein [Schinkia azotoformans]